MKKSNNNSGKMIAVILVIAFLGINYFKTENEGGPQEQAFAKEQQKQTEARKFDNKLVKSHNVEKLKYAYTGNWEKNQVAANVGEYQFTPPGNHRAQVEATAAKKKDDKKKKKVAAKKKKTNKLAKKSRRSIYDLSHSGATQPPYTQTAGYYQAQQQNREPTDEKAEKALTVQEWMELIAKTGSISELLNKRSAGEVSQDTFFAVAELLLSSQDDAQKKLGFEAIGQYPSYNSLAKYANHIGDDMKPETKAYAESTLDAYGPAQLRVLNSALNSQNTKVQITAANLIRDITSTILGSEAASGENVVYSETQLAQYRIMLTQSRDVLNRLKNSVRDNDVVASFTATLAELNQFLG